MVRFAAALLSSLCVFAAVIGLLAARVVFLVVGNIFAQAGIPWIVILQSFGIAAALALISSALPALPRGPTNSTVPSVTEYSGTCELLVEKSRPSCMCGVTVVEPKFAAPPARNLPNRPDTTSFVVGDTRQLAQHRDVALLHRLRVVRLAEAVAAEPERVGLVDAARAAHVLEALGNDEERVADDRERQRDLQADEDHRDLAAHQGGEDGADFHGESGIRDSGLGIREEPVSLLRIPNLESRIPAFHTFICAAGCTRHARQVGYNPASTAATIAYHIVPVTETKVIGIVVTIADQQVIATASRQGVVAAAAVNDVVVSTACQRVSTASSG